MYSVLMYEFSGLHPELIDNFTFEQVAVLLQNIQVYRNEVPRTDVSIMNLIKGLAGDSTSSAKPSQSSQPSLAPRFSMSKEEIDAFCNEGMPSPVSKWLTKYRKIHGKPRRKS